MRIAYLCSSYPAVSHTFITREVIALRELGHDVRTFSIRRAMIEHSFQRSVTKEFAGSLTDEERRTAWLVPPPPGQLIRAIGWAIVTRPIRATRALADAVLSRRAGHEGRLKWCAYFLEGVLLAYWLARDNTEHLHCHFGNHGSSTGMIASFLAGVPFSITCHGSELREIPRYRLVDKVDRATFVASVSHFGRAQLMLACDERLWNKLLVIRCGFPPVNRAAQAIPRRPASPTEILCVARLSKEKGHLVLLDALARLRSLGRDFRCTLVGDGPLRDAIERRRAMLGLDTVVTLTGSLPPEQMEQRYLAADLVVLASFSEGVPVVLMEAVAYGKPVVATSVGGVSELIRPGSGGLLVPPGDAPALASAIQRVLDEPGLAATLVSSAQSDAILAEFDVAKSAQLLACEFLRSADADRRHPAAKGL